MLIIPFFVLSVDVVAKWIEKEIKGLGYIFPLIGMHTHIVGTWRVFLLQMKLCSVQKIW